MLLEYRRAFFEAAGISPTPGRTRDAHIQLLEMLPLALCMGTLHDILEGTLWTEFSDNDAVLGTMLNGATGFTSQDLCNHIGRERLQCSKLRMLCKYGEYLPNPTSVMILRRTLWFSEDLAPIGFIGEVGLGDSCLADVGVLNKLFLRTCWMAGLSDAGKNSV